MRSLALAASAVLLLSSPALAAERVHFDDRLTSPKKSTKPLPDPAELKDKLEKLDIREVGRWLGDYDVRTALSGFVDRYPATEAAGKALLLLGDYCFDLSDLDASAKAYQRILQSPRYSAFADAARYKLGWIHVNRGKAQDFATALRLFEQAARGSDATLRSTAATDLVFAWTEVRPARDPVAFFQGLPIPREVQLRALGKLANRYYVKMQLPDALALYRKLIELAPQAEARPDWEDRVRDIEKQQR